MSWTPADGEIAEWLGRLRAAAPGWGVLYDPGRMVWMAVRGRDTLLTARTPAELAERIAAHIPVPDRPAGCDDGRYRLKPLPPGVVREVSGRPGMAPLRP